MGSGHGQKLFLLFCFFIRNQVAADAFGPPISNSTECKEDVQRRCGGLESRTILSNLAVLNCLQDYKREEDADLSESCHHYLWNFKYNLTRDDRFLEAAQDTCKSDLEEMEHSNLCSRNQDDFLECAIEHKDTVKSQMCRTFLRKMATILFSNYRYIQRFADACKNDIDTLKCGRVDSRQASGVQQGYTIECLSSHVKELTRECHLETLRVAEMQADDYHLDRPVYFACRDDRENFCRQIVAGDGKVYKCLMKHKLDPTMSLDCREQLTRRQQLISQDFKVSGGLAKFCHEDIAAHECEFGKSKQKTFQLSKILLCLENALHEGRNVSNQCQGEMLEHRQSLLQDYRLSPEIVANCEQEIKLLCPGKGIGGKTIHCLMKRIRMQRKKPDVGKVGAQCVRSVEDLIRETDSGTITWEADPVLKEACLPVVDRYCGRTRGNGNRVISCLMSKIGADEMTSICEATLMEIQYFASRDFRLDSQLYEKCRHDAHNFCNAPEEWSNSNDNTPDSSPMVLPCLYRHAYQTEGALKLKDDCLVEVRRVMRERAVSVELQPELEEKCLPHLTVLCLNRTGKGEEMLCLQDNLEKLSPDCQKLVSDFTEEESQNIDLNPVIVQSCGAFLDTHCQLAQDSGDEGEVMACLIQEKMSEGTKMSAKCKSSIEHFQLITMKDYKFTYKFKQACKESVKVVCPLSRKKSSVVACLSEKIRNDTIDGFAHLVNKECRRQVKALLFELHENIEMNPDLKAACLSDIHKFCWNVTAGQGQVVECLKLNRLKLAPPCHKGVFTIEKDEMEDNSLDVSLNHVCASMKAEHCRGVAEEQVLECLKDRRQEAGFDEECLKVVIRRMVDQSMDIRLDPLFRNSCQVDIKAHCGHIWSSAPEDEELKGQVIECLKKSFVRKETLTAPCENRLRKIIQESVLDSRLDPILRETCAKEIPTFCQLQLKEEELNKEDGSVEECLKKAFLKKLLQGACNVQVARLVEASRIDIQADPVLHRACSNDLQTKCNSVMPGQGRLISCLMIQLKTGAYALEPSCKELLELRVTMFDSAQKMKDGILIEFDSPSSSAKGSENSNECKNSAALLDEDDPFNLRLFEQKRHSLELGLQIEKELNDTFGFNDPGSKPDYQGRKSDDTKPIGPSSNCPEEVLVQVDFEDVADGMDWDLIDAEIKTITSQLSQLSTSPSKVLSMSPIKSGPLSMYDFSPGSHSHSPLKKTPRKTPCKTPIKTDFNKLKQALEKVKSHATPGEQQAKRQGEVKAPPLPGRGQSTLRRSGSLTLKGRKTPAKVVDSGKGGASSQKPELKKMPAAANEAATKSEGTFRRGPLRSSGSLVKTVPPVMKPPVRPVFSLRGDTSSRNSSANSSVNISVGSSRSNLPCRNGPLKATAPVRNCVRRTSILGSSSTNDSSDASRSFISTPNRSTVSLPAAASTPATRSVVNYSFSSKLRPPQLRTPSKELPSLTASFASPIPPVPKFQLDRQRSMPLTKIKLTSPVKSSNVLGDRNVSGIRVPKILHKPPLLRRPSAGVQGLRKTEKENVPAPGK